MLKGCQRKTIIIKGGRESVFEVAYFLVKPQTLGSADCERASAENMISAANKLIEENKLTCEVKGKSRNKSKINTAEKKCFFSAGFVCGVLLCIGILLVHIFISS